MKSCYLNQWWLLSLMSYGVTRPQWVKTSFNDSKGEPMQLSEYGHLNDESICNCPQFPVRPVDSIDSCGFNPMRPRYTLCQQISSSTSVWLMACHLFGAKSLPELMLTDYPLDLQEQISVEVESKYQCIHSRKRIWKCCLQNCSHFVEASMCYAPQPSHNMLLECYALSMAEQALSQCEMLHM